MKLRPGAELLRRLGAILFLGAAALFLGLALLRQREELLGFHWEIEPVRLAASLLLLIAAIGASAAIWQLALRQLELRVPPVVLARIWFISSLGRYIPGKLWQLVGVAELSRRAGIPPVAGLTSLAVIMGFQLLAAWLVGVYLVPTAALGELAPLLPAARLTAPLLLLLLHPALLERLIALAARLARRPLGAWHGTWASSLLLLALSLLQWLGFGLAFQLFVSSLTDVTMQEYTALAASFALAFVAGYVVVFVPAGLGAKEGALALLLSSSMPLSVAAAMAVAARVWTITAELLPALLLLRGPWPPSRLPGTPS